MSQQRPIRNEVSLHGQARNKAQGLGFDPSAPTQPKLHRCLLPALALGIWVAEAPVLSYMAKLQALQSEEHPLEGQCHPGSSEQQEYTPRRSLCFLVTSWITQICPNLTGWHCSTPSQWTCHRKPFLRCESPTSGEEVITTPAGHGSWFRAFKERGGPRVCWSNTSSDPWRIKALGAWAPKLPGDAHQSSSVGSSEEAPRGGTEGSRSGNLEDPMAHSGADIVLGYLGYLHSHEGLCPGQPSLHAVDIKAGQ